MNEANTMNDILGRDEADEPKPTPLEVLQADLDNCRAVAKGAKIAIEDYQVTIARSERRAAELEKAIAKLQADER